MNYYGNDILKKISNDIFLDKNPIKYHLSFFNHSWNKNISKIESLSTKLALSIQKLKILIDDNFILNNLSRSYDWNLIKHDYPINYEYWIKTHNKILFKEFNDIYNKRLIYFNKFNSLKLINLYTQNLVDENILNILDYFQNGYFISLDIKLYVENNINCCDHYMFDYIDLYFFYSKTISPKIKIDLIKHILIISKWIYELNPIHKINLIYFDTPNKKEILESSDIQYLSSQNINSGSSATGYKIMIWRREEITKVLIHELIHYLNMDIKNDPHINLIIKHNIGQFDYPVLINETITEIQAQFLHSVYISTMISKSNTILDNLKTIYNFEMIYSWYQFAKIMTYYNITNYKLSLIKDKLNQTTNVFSYYILKSILTIDFTKIIFELDHIKKLLIVDKNYISNCNVNQCDILIKYISNLLRNPPKKILDKIIKHLKLDDNSLRMSIFGYY